MTCFYLTKDLFLSTRIGGLGHACQVSVEVISSAEVLSTRLRTEPRSLVIIDLTLSGLDLAATVRQLREVAADCRIVAYGPHVDTDRLSEARAAGCDEVLPRSQLDHAIRRIFSSGEWTQPE